MIRPAVPAAALAVLLAAFPSAQQRSVARSMTWHDAAPVHGRLAASGIRAASFPAFITRIQRTNARRVQEGDLDHLIFYVLQSTTFTGRPPIEPALSAKAHAEGGEIPEAVRRRAKDFLQAIDGLGRGDARRAYFRRLSADAFPDRNTREAALLREYVRVMKFVYEKEFVAQRAPNRQVAVAELYRTRGLSTDTAVEAGFLVSEGLAVLRALDPAFRIRRVLIVGPGLDIAPRTGLIDARDPESYQPWMVIDALVALGLSRLDALDVVCADINPRVVRHLRDARRRPPALTLASEIRESGEVMLSDQFRAYFAAAGGSIGRLDAAPSMPGRAAKVVRVSPSAARAVTAETLDIVTERLAPADFDLVIATNILPYFDDVELALAMTNIAAMLAPGGVFLHNEPRPIMEDLSGAVKLPLEQARQAIVANVTGAPPLVDSVFLHRRR